MDLFVLKAKRSLNPGFNLRFASVGAEQRSPGPHAPHLPRKAPKPQGSIYASLRSAQNRGPPDLMRPIFRERSRKPRVQSTLRFGRRRTEVPRTSCAPSSAKGPENPGFNLRFASVGKELSYLFQKVNRDCRSALFFAFYVKC